MNANLDPNDIHTLNTFLFGIRGVPLNTGDLAWRLGNDIALRPGGRATVALADKVAHAETGWTADMLRAAIADGIPQTVNIDRWEERFAAGY